MARRLTPLALALISTAAVLYASCSSDKPSSGDAVQPPSTVTVASAKEAVGANGGIVSTGSASVEFPVGAVSAPETVRMVHLRPSGVNLESGLVSVRDHFEITMSGASLTGSVLFRVAAPSDASGVLDLSLRHELHDGGVEYLASEGPAGFVSAHLTSFSNIYFEESSPGVLVGTIGSRNVILSTSCDAPYESVCVKDAETRTQLASEGLGGSDQLFYMAAESGALATIGAAIFSNPAAATLDLFGKSLEELANWTLANAAIALQGLDYYPTDGDRTHTFNMTLGGGYSGTASISAKARRFWVYPYVGGYDPKPPWLAIQPEVAFSDKVPSNARVAFFVGGVGCNGSVSCGSGQARYDTPDKMWIHVNRLNQEFYAPDFTVVAVLTANRPGICLWRCEVVIGAAQVIDRGTASAVEPPAPSVCPGTLTPQTVGQGLTRPIPGILPACSTFGERFDAQNSTTPVLTYDAIPAGTDVLMAGEMGVVQCVERHLVEKVYKDPCGQVGKAWVYQGEIDPGATEYWLVGIHLADGTWIEYRFDGDVSVAKGATVRRGERIGVVRRQVVLPVGMRTYLILSNGYVEPSGPLSFATESPQFFAK